MLRKNMERFQALLQKYNADYYSTERYLQRKLCPVIAIPMIPELMRRPDALQIAQHIYTSIMVKAYVQRVMALVEQSALERQRLAIHAVGLDVIGHGDCGELSSRLIIDLMMMSDEFPVIYQCMLNEKSRNNHAYVLVEDNQGNRIALDPFFNICCSMEDYPKQQKLNDYFKSTIPGWVFPTGAQSLVYNRADYLPLRQRLNDDLKALRELNDPVLEKIKASFKKFAELRNKPFSFKHVKPFLMQCFMEDIRQNGENVSSLQLELAIDPQSFRRPEKIVELGLFAIAQKEKLVADIKKITGMTGYKNLHACLDNALKDGQFTRALRMACTGVGEKAYLVVKRLLDDKALVALNINEQAGAEEKAAIHYAVEKGDERIIQLLLDKGADPKLPDKNGNTAEKFLQKCRI